MLLGRGTENTYQERLLPRLINGWRDLIVLLLVLALEGTHFFWCVPLASVSNLYITFAVPLFLNLRVMLKECVPLASVSNLYITFAVPLFLNLPVMLKECSYKLLDCGSLHFYAVQFQIQMFFHQFHAFIFYCHTAFFFLISLCDSLIFACYPQDCVSEIIKQARRLNVPIVVDGVCNQ